MQEETPAAGPVCGTCGGDHRTEDHETATATEPQEGGGEAGVTEAPAGEPPTEPTTPTEPAAPSEPAAPTETGKEAEEETGEEAPPTGQPSSF